MKNIELVYRTEDMEKGKIRVIPKLNSIPDAMAVWERVKITKQNIEYAYLRKFRGYDYATIKILKNKGGEYE